jgi:hypothetical protein
VNAVTSRFMRVLVAVYIAKQVLTVLVFPPFTGHDEVAHFQYVRVLATEFRVPTLYSHRLPQDLYGYRAYSITWNEPAKAPLYTAVHPPLYYALMSPIYRAADGLSPEQIQYVLRCAAIPFGLMVVLLASALTRAIFPHDAFLAITVPTVVAFQPQVSYEAAMVNNDIVIVAIYSLLLYLLVLTVRNGLSTRRAVVIGLVAGVALLAKATALTAVVLIPLAFWMGKRQDSWAALARATAVAYGLVVVIAAPWWWFMAHTYGDPMAFAALAATQPDLIRDEPFLSLLFSGRFLVDRWAETWGEFGWKLIPINRNVTFGLALVSVAGLMGLFRYASPHDTPGGLTRWQIHALVLLALACLTSYLSVVQFGTHFVLTQARYYFPVVNAATLLILLGLRAWIPVAWRMPACVVVVLAAIALNISIYTIYVVPYWHFRP